MTVIEKTLVQIKKLQKLNKQSFMSIIESSIIENSQELIKIQKSQQEIGENKDGQTIGVYSKTTELIAAKENPIKPKRAGSPYNLQWSGDMFRKTKITINKTSDNVVMNITSDSSNLFKLKNTIDRHGLVDSDTIYGYNTENKNKASKKVSEIIKSKTKKYVQL